MRQSGLLFVYSEGFHPHPKISFPFATSVGMESLGEYADIEVESPGKDMTKLAEKINFAMPAGLRILNIEEIPPNTDSLSKTIKGFRYDIILPENGEIPLSLEKGRLLDEKIDAFLRTEEFIISREKKGRQIEKNIRPLVDTISFNRQVNRIKASLSFGKEGGVRPAEILTHVLGLDAEAAKRARIIKTDTLFHADESRN
jgi:Uncharacterized protein conserved in bacteria